MKEQAITKHTPEKSLLVSIHKKGGRGGMGRITVRHRGGGSRKIWRQIDFGEQHRGVAGTIRAFEYDPNRNATIALVDYADGAKGYILAAQGVAVGGSVLCEETAEIKPGNRMRLANMPVGTMAHNVELEPGRGGVLVRGAGTASIVAAQEGSYTHLQMPSSEIRKVSNLCFATVGMVSNPEARYQRIHNAGRSRLMGIRPTVRGTVMNPVDHPHGGGEGRQPIGLKHPKTPWGKPALGVKTRRKTWTNKLILQRRKKKKKK